MATIGHIARVALLGAAVFAFSHASLSAQGAGQIDGEGFRKIHVAPGAATGAAFFDVVLPYLGDHPESLEGNASLEMTIEKVDDAFRVEIIKSGYLDDSIRGEHFRGHVIMNTNGEWELTDMSVRPTCWRGEAREGRCP